MRTAHLLSVSLLSALAACGSTTDAASGSQEIATAPAGVTPAVTPAAAPAEAPAEASAPAGLYALDAITLGGETRAGTGA